jgi:hypothetical protein
VASESNEIKSPREVEDSLRLFAGSFNSPFPKLEPALEVFQKEYMGGT